MSGGHFDYKQYEIANIADQIEHEIETNNIPDEWGYCSNFSEETLAKFKEAIDTLRKAHVMIHRIDWLLSGDDGEETFHSRWEKDLRELSDEPIKS